MFFGLCLAVPTIGFYSHRLDHPSINPHFETFISQNTSQYNFNNSFLLERKAAHARFLFQLYFANDHCKCILMQNKLLLTTELFVLTLIHL